MSSLGIRQGPTAPGLPSAAAAASSGASCLVLETGIARLFFNVVVFVGWVNPDGLVFSVLCLAVRGVNNGHNSCDPFFSVLVPQFLSRVIKNKPPIGSLGSGGSHPLVLTTGSGSSSRHPWVRRSRPGPAPAGAAAGRAARTPETAAAFAANSRVITHQLFLCPGSDHKQPLGPLPGLAS